MLIDPHDLAAATVEFEAVDFQRVFWSAHMDDPLGTGTSAARFSSADGSFRTLYAAATLDAAIAETIIRDRFEGGGGRSLFASEIESRCVAQIQAVTPLRLVDLRTDGCFQLGISTDIVGAKGTASGWAQSRELAGHVHSEPTMDGILYKSRLTDVECIAVFDRAVGTKLAASSVMMLAAAPLLPEALDRLRTRIIA